MKRDILIIIGGVFLFTLIRFNGLNIVFDESCRIIASQNLFEYGNYSVKRYSIDNNQFYYYNLYSSWPILETVFIGLSNFFTKNFISSFISVQLLFSIILVTSLWNFLKIYLLDVKIALAAFLSVVANPFLIKQLWSTDLYSFALSTLAIAYATRKRDLLSLKLGELATLTFLFTLPSLFRFSYYPLAFVPLGLLLYNIIFRNHIFKYEYLVTLFIPTIIIASQTLLIILNSEQVAFVQNSESGFYLTNLNLAKAPFSSLFFGLRDSIVFQIVSVIKKSNSISNLAPYFFKFLIISEYLVTMILILKMVKSINQLNILFSIIIASILLPLIFLTLTKEKSFIAGADWSYLSEPRYLIVPSVIILAKVFQFLKNTDYYRDFVLISTSGLYLILLVLFTFYKKNTKYTDVYDYLKIDKYLYDIKINKKYLAFNYYTSDYLVSKGYSVETVNVAQLENILLKHPKDVELIVTNTQELEIVKQNYKDIKYNVFYFSE